MSKLFIEDSTLSAIGNAIREKTGKTDLIAPGAMPAEIKSIVSGGGGEGDCNGLHIPDEALVITGNGTYRFAYDGWNWFIEACGDRITTKDLSGALYMFSNAANLTNIPFDLNFTMPLSDGLGTSMNNMFNSCSSLITPPKVTGIRPSDMNNIFSNCHKLKSVPDDWTATWDWRKIDNETSAYAANMSSMFTSCFNLRKLPDWTFLHMNPKVGYSYAIVYALCNGCYSIEKIEGIRLPAQATWTSNAFYNTFNECYRLKTITFALQPDGSPYVHNIKNQTIDLTKTGFIPYGQNNYNIFLLQCPDFTEADQITSYDKWAAYCGETSLDTGSGNGFAYSTDYAVFSRKSAKKMFATLPDVTGGSGNTIKLEYDAASALKSQEAMKLLTEEEIAVATARGWTVTLV